MNDLKFIGRLADAPSLTTKGETRIAKLTLIRNQFAGTDEQGNKRERKIAIPFTAFGSTADSLHRYAMKGDQIIVSAEVHNNNYIVNGEEKYSYDFVISEYEFGAPGPAKREQLATQD